METVDVEVDDEVIEFFRTAVSDLNVSNPVATLIYGRFSDESVDHFRIAVSERSSLSVGPAGSGAIYRVPMLGDLYIPDRLVEMVRGKSLSLENDLVVLRERG